MSRRLSLLLAMCVGCGAASGSGDPLTSGLPSRATLAVTPIQGNAGTASPGASGNSLGSTAGLALVTQQTTERVNALVGGVLDTLSSIARTEPAEVGPKSAVWGPIADPTSPLVWRLLVTRVGPGEQTFQLDVGLPAAGGADFHPFLQGASQGAGPSGPSQGVFVVDLALAHQLDPVGHPDDGRVAARWTVATEGRNVHVQLLAVRHASGPPATGGFDAVLLVDGSGVLNFDVYANLVAGPAMLELGQVGAHWDGLGAGRADAEVHGGDAQAGGALTECWSAGDTLVYLQAVSADGGSDTEGSVSSCVFATPVG
jgi:hypothetical protein